MKDNIIRDKSYGFALKIVLLYKELLERHEFILSKQLVRSATSIGANVEEAIAGQSRKDFISKMSVASKEARETHYWIRLLRDGQFVQQNQADNLIKDIEEIIKILTAIVKTASN
ncbi:MAG: four helix bundle protein [Planctomycetota bacterium]|nr:four helix bundle protein [Planctomycetota bacterium]MDI6788066.1 four helix bundle protein [Planctomycetota bacterium]